jgi:hypothetical protein
MIQRTASALGSRGFAQPLRGTHPVNSLPMHSKKSIEIAHTSSSETSLRHRGANPQSTIPSGGNSWAEVIAALRKAGAVSLPILSPHFFLKERGKHYPSSKRQTCNRGFAVNDRRCGHQADGRANHAGGHA